MSILTRAYDEWEARDTPSPRSAREALGLLRLSFLECSRKGARMLSIPALLSQQEQAAPPVAAPAPTSPLVPELSTAALLQSKDDRAAAP